MSDTSDVTATHIDTEQFSQLSSHVTEQTHVINLPMVVCYVTAHAVQRVDFLHVHEPLSCSIRSGSEAVFIITPHQ